MIVADTSVWIDYVNGVITEHTNILDYELQYNKVIIGDIIITEFLQGFRDEHEFLIAKKIMDSLDCRNFLGKENSIQAAQNFRTLRKKGITVRKTIDVIIATFCIENDYELLHNDRDFDYMEAVLGLRVRK